MVNQNLSMLQNAIKAYNYPAVAFDFKENKEVNFKNNGGMKMVEELIRQQLLSNDTDQVFDGLSNVLYWGHYNAGYRDIRVEKFRSGVTTTMLQNFQNIANEAFDLIKLKKIKMPQFSGMAFVSKIAMFLNPDKFTTLDKKIILLKDENSLNNPLNAIHFRIGKDSGISITQKSNNGYNNWCLFCSNVGNELNVRPVDVERGFFYLVSTGQSAYAKAIIKQFAD